MDDQATLIARNVAMAAAARFNAPQDVEAYRQLAAAVGTGMPTAPLNIDAPPAELVELLDELADIAVPQALAALLPDVTTPLLREARRQVGPYHPSVPLCGARLQKCS